MEISYTIISFGGASNENEVSVITGTMACNVLKRAGRNILPLYISQEGEFFAGGELADIALFKGEGYKKAAKAIIADGGIYTLSKRGKIKAFFKADCLLNCCHGGWGEGGGMSGLCAAADIPLAGAGMFGSAAFMDKYLTKIVLAGLNIKCAEYRYFKSLDEAEGIDLQYPLIIKPVSLGSSIGVMKVENGDELKVALGCAFLLDSGAIAEKYFVDKREINCAAYRDFEGVKVSPCEEAVSGGELLSFEDKYEGGGKSVFPADIPKDVEESIRGITREVYERLNLRGIVRMDYILSGGEIYLSEVNTVPGSLSYYLISKGWEQFGRALCGVIDFAIHEHDTSKKRIIKTGILENLPSNACKRGQKGL